LAKNFYSYEKRQQELKKKKKKEEKMKKRLEKKQNKDNPDYQPEEEAPDLVGLGLAPEEQDNPDQETEPTE
jgi:hypothetical protein